MLPAHDALERWHRFTDTGNAGLLDDLLADDVTFHPPTYWTPRRGKLEVALVLGTVATVLQDFRYERQWVDGSEWALEFTATVGGLQLHGVDLIRLDEAGRIVELEVVARPPNAVAALRAAMEARLRPFLEGTS
jgi:hypothetical protein